MADISFNILCYIDYIIFKKYFLTYNISNQIEMGNMTSAKHKTIKNVLPKT